MAVTITVTLVPSGEPKPVQIVLAGVPTGAAYTVVGTAAGSSWPVPGGSGVSAGATVNLVDNRAAVNTPVTYVATVDGVTYSSTAITVPWAAGRYLLQSLDGQTVVEFVWRRNGLPRDYVDRAAVSDVPGRARPPVRYATGGDGGGALELRTARADTERLVSLLKAGRPVVLRTDGQMRDQPAVDLLLLRRPRNVTWDAVVSPGQFSTDRVWALDYLLVDDPEPSTVLAAWTGGDFDAAMGTRTWSDFDALFASSTGDDFDTYPWGQL